MTDQTAAPTTADALETILGERYSCRGFLPREVPEDVVRRAARQRAEQFGWDRTVARMLALHAGDRVGVLSA